MALSYKNQRTGRVVTMLEPTEVEDQAEAEAEALARKGTKKSRNMAERVAELGRKKAIHVKHTIIRMDASETWQRVSDKTPEVQPVAAAPASEQPTSRDAKAVWVDYAVSQGADRDEAEDLTKADLVDLYGEDSDASSTGDD